MALGKIFGIAASAMAAQSQRLNVIASNLANAESAISAGGAPYRARQVVFSAVPVDAAASAVRVAGVVEDPSPQRKVHDPGHPLADADGYVTYPNVDVVEEMVNMISASRSYQNNAEVMATARHLMLKALAIGE
ncbi:flagellar basal body rod protein FlgC [Pelomicrobium sp.]|jgi:flagellar basal-body rod protein FlgC|uniref:flagellar basal body rod protein FlgC n=1 Tax=Pelomicrobium sp. TaxID=2815319 RepID=UPI002FDD72D7